MAKKFKADFSDIPQQNTLDELLNDVINIIPKSIDSVQLMDKLQAKPLQKTIQNPQQNVVDSTSLNIGDLSENELNESIDDALENIDDLSVEDLTDIQVKNKQIFLRNVVGNAIMSRLVTTLDKASKGEVISRKTSLTTISNINKRIGGNTDLKLSKDCYTIKPKNIENVKKGTRIIISIDDEYRINNHVIIYIQMGVDKFIKSIEFTQKQFNWMVRFIGEFYNNTFEYSKAKLVMFGSDNKEHNELIELMKLVVRNNLLVAPINNKNSEHIGFKIRTKKHKNTWLTLMVTRSENMFNIFGVSDIKSEFHWSLDRRLTYDEFIGQIDSIIELFEIDWMDKFGVDMYNNLDELNLSKISYPQLRRVYKYLSENNIKIIKVLSNADITEMNKKLGKSRFDSYDAETIIFKPENMLYVALSQVNNITNKDASLNIKYIKFQAEYQVSLNQSKEYLNGDNWKLMLSQIGI